MAEKNCNSLSVIVQARPLAAPAERTKKLITVLDWIRAGFRFSGKVRP